LIFGAIPDGTLSSRRVVPHLSSPIYPNVTFWVQNQRFELKLGPNRSVSVKITNETIQTQRKQSKTSNTTKTVFLSVPYFLFLSVSKDDSWQFTSDLAKQTSRS